MKIVLNYGGYFDLPESIWDRILSKGMTFDADDDNDRANQKVISMLEECGINDQGFVNGTPSYSHLSIVEIPDESTDFRIFHEEYESLVYAVDGKIHVI